MDHNGFTHTDKERPDRESQNNFFFSWHSSEVIDRASSERRTVTKCLLKKLKPVMRTLSMTWQWITMESGLQLPHQTI
uniref:Uncharacterized protein n=1 Tax=Salix viminalis TaxID=40686 RepID=A0A6N2NH88_SALVM